jgi:cell division septal protein FtsQ
MDQADKYAAQAAADRAKAQKKEQEEFFIVALVVVLLTVLGVVGYYFVQEAIEFAKSKPAHFKKLHA